MPNTATDRFRTELRARVEELQVEIKQQRGEARKHREEAEAAEEHADGLAQLVAEYDAVIRRTTTTNRSTEA